MPSTKCSAVSGWPSSATTPESIRLRRSWKVHAWVGLPSYQTERDRLYRIDCDTASLFDAITLQV